MIIELDGDSAENLAAATRDLAALTQNWGHKLTTAHPDTSTPARTHRHDDKTVDPVALTALVVSLPSAALAVTDLADRIRARHRAQQLIDHARHMAHQSLTMRLIARQRPVELSTLDPDQLLDLLTDEDPTN